MTPKIIWGTGKNIRYWRVKRGYSQVKLGELMYKRSTPRTQPSSIGGNISNYENEKLGFSNPSTAVLRRFAKVLECSTADLLREDMPDDSIALEVLESYGLNLETLAAENLANQNLARENRTGEHYAGERAGECRA
jgi:transcriptional regulator with XRE-family HTH domain